MYKRCGIVLALLLCCLFCLSAQADDAENPVVRRALLVGCGEFLSHESITPSAALNVRRMAAALAADIRGYDAIVSVEQGVGSVQALRELMQQTFADTDDNDVSVVYFCTHGLYDRVTFQPLLVLSDGETEENADSRVLCRAAHRRGECAGHHRQLYRRQHSSGRRAGQRAGDPAATDLQPKYRQRRADRAQQGYSHTADDRAARRGGG